ncbi:MAG: EamA family transporter [Syntrophotaleaceae bacterium]
MVFKEFLCVLCVLCGECFKWPFAFRSAARALPSILHIDSDLMSSWYLLTLASLVLLGGQRFLYKVAAEAGCNAAMTTLSFMGSVALFSWIAYFAEGAVFLQPGPLLIVGLVNSVGFLGSSLASIEALKELPASVAYTLTRLSTVLVVIFSLLYFGERLSTTQSIGVILALAVLLLFAGKWEDGGERAGNYRRGFFLAILAILAGAAASISSKFAAMYVDKFGFMAVSYSFGALFSILARKQLLPDKPGERTGPALWIGLAMGITNFIGYYALLEALAVGPLAIIAPLTSMHFVIAILLSLIIYRERTSFLRLAGIGLTVASILLMKA